jgi:peptidoglycan/xylan/chitin deacetylase (PgdA/CDA1 family)
MEDYTMGQIGHGGIESRAPADFRWPGGRRVGVIFRVTLEGWSDGKWPGSGPMANPLKPGVIDLNAVYWADYGPRCGIHRLLEILKRHDVRATVLVNGVITERYPDAVRKVASAGHEIVAHSYAMDVIPAYLDEEEERINIRRTTKAIEAVCGVTPKGWISPRATPSVNTARLLAEEGYEWHGDYLNDDLPFEIRFGDKTIIAAPGSMEVNDMPMYVRYGNPPRAMLEVFEDTLAALLANKSEVGKIDVTAHAHVFGRPSGAWVYERIIEIAKAHPDVWIGTRGELASQLSALR